VTKPDRGLHELEEERAVPWGDPGLFAWHRARYEFACGFAHGRRVLDVGSGEGYGASMLAAVAEGVVGVDYSPTAIAHARATYNLPGLAFEVRDVNVLPASFGRFDLVTCFEVIEHLEDPQPLVDTLAAATAANGICLVSTPNAAVDRLFEAVAARRRYEYHVGLLSVRDFRRVLRRSFESVEVLGQSERRGALHTLLKSADVFNLRHRVIRSPGVQTAMRGALDAPSGRPAAISFRFSRLLAQQSPALLAIARRPLGAAL
jgi:SAM-dependent methyltransferase